MENNNFLKIKKLLNFAYTNKFSDFYRAKYDKYNFNPLTDFNSINDIEKIPLLTKKELSQTPLDKILFVKEKDIKQICQTSGTTGNPMIIFRSEQKGGLEIIKDINLGWALFLANISRATRFNLSYNKRIIGDIHKLSESCQLAAKLGIKTIVTTPTLAIILKDYLQKYPELQKSLKFFLLSGELETPAKKKIMKQFYPNVKFFSIYGTSETGVICYQCLNLAGRESAILLHPLLKYFYLEIINPDTGQAVKLGEKGELVLTDLCDHATPLIRYKTGDLVSFHKNNCPCGASGPLLQNWGRINYDFVRAGGFELRRDMLEKSLLNLKNYITENFEANIYENFVDTKPKIKIVLSLSLKKGVEELGGLKKIIADEFMKNWQLSPRLNLKTATEAGLFEPLEIKFISFPISAKTRGILILH